MVSAASLAPWKNSNYGDIPKVVFLLQSITLNAKHLVKLNNLFYKFIWNRHYLTSRAPERIKREIVNTPVKFVNLGMHDLSMLNKGLKLRASHPLILKSFDKIDLTDLFFPKSLCKVDKVINAGLYLFKEARLRLIGIEAIAMNSNYIVHLRSTQIDNVVNWIGKGSLAYFYINRLGKAKIGIRTPGCKMEVVDISIGL